MAQRPPEYPNVPPTIRSCLNCAHLAAWYFPATYNDPGDEGMECSHEEGAWQTIEIEAEQFPTEKEELAYTASQCEFWEYCNWEAQRKAEAESEAASLKEMWDADDCAEFRQMEQDLAGTGLLLSEDNYFLALEEAGYL